MDARFWVFFGHYVALICAALIWGHQSFVRHRPGASLHLFQLLCAAGVLYVTVRAYLEYRGRIPARWQWVGLYLDILFVSLAVGLTGGPASEAALLYFWPIAVSAIRRRWVQTLSAGVLSAIAYCIVARPPGGVPTSDYLEQMGTRLGVLVFATSLAAWFSGAEGKRLEELTALREQVALGRYRERLSREMHDGIQHYLVSIGLQLEVAAQLAAKAPEQALAIALDQRFTARQAAEELRYLVRRLRAEAVEPRSFSEAVRTHLAAVSRGPAGVIELELEGAERPLAPEAEHGVFRILQEAVTNAVKHAAGCGLRVCLCYGPSELVCTVRDAGPGFDLVAHNAGDGAEGLGLASMSERAASIGAALTIETAPGEGTEVRLRVPLGPPGHEGETAVGGDCR